MQISHLNQLAPETALILNHIPKSGGTSIIEFFRKVMGSDRCYQHRERNFNTDEYSLPLEALGLNHLKKLDFVGGHFQYGQHVHFIGRPSLYIGIVRNPVERFISDYYYNRSVGRAGLKELTNRLSLSEYLDHKFDSGSSDLVTNSQIRTLTGQTSLSAARRVLNRHYFLCCTIQQLTRAQLLMAVFFNVDIDPFHANITQKKTAGHDQILSDTQKERINSNCQTDLIFNRMVEQMFNEAEARFLRLPPGQRLAFGFKALDLLNSDGGGRENMSI